MSKQPYRIGSFKPRTCVSELDDFELGWVVGLIEGEGCISAHNDKAAIIVVSTDYMVLFRMKSILKCGRISERKTALANRKRMWAYKISVAADVAAVIELTYEHLSLRRQDQCRKVLDTCYVPLDPRFSIR
jgi:hypothetical protein